MCKKIGLGPFHGICEVTSKILKSEFDQNTKCIC